MERGILLFYTATILKWQHLFDDIECKEIIIKSLRFLSNNSLIHVYAFVIMPNHVHILIEVPKNIDPSKDIQHSFMSFTAHKFKEHLQNDNRLTKYYVDDIDRKYQFWERNPKVVEVSDSNMAASIVDYIHLNPLQEKWSIVKEPEDYEYSSALFYSQGAGKFEFLNHYMDYFNRK